MKIGSNRSCNVGGPSHSVADNFYGDPDEYPQIVIDNQDLPQPDGRTLAEARQIFAGYRLVIRNPSHVRAEHDAVYIVKRGDTLSGVALREFGDAGLWPKLFERNVGAELGDGHVLTNPNLIWPGLRLHEDLAYVDAAAASSDVDPSAAAPEPIASPEPAAASPASVTPEPQPAPPTSIPIVASPTPVRTTPPPVPLAVSQPASTEVPTAVPIVAAAPAPEPDRPGMPVQAGLIAAAGASAALLSFAAARSLRRRWPTSVFQSDVVMDGGFAQAMGDELAYEQLTGALAEDVLRLAAATGHPDVRLLAARAGRTQHSRWPSCSLAKVSMIRPRSSTTSCWPGRVRPTAGTDRNRSVARRSRRRCSGVTPRWATSLVWNGPAIN